MTIIEIFANENRVIEREATPEEIAQREIDEAHFQQVEAEKVAKIAARQAVLDRLGLTEEEAQLILGGSN